MQSIDDIRKELERIDTIRANDNERLLAEFRRGELAGAEQALYWCEGGGMIPTDAILARSEDRALLGIQG